MQYGAGHDSTRGDAPSGDRLRCHANDPLEGCDRGSICRLLGRDFIKPRADLADSEGGSPRLIGGGGTLTLAPRSPGPLDRVFTRLPTRIVFFVFAVTLFTSLTVAGVSVRSTSHFLREKINHQYESTLAEASEQIESWYSERQGELEVFTSSDVLSQVVPRALATQDSRRKQRATREASMYLQYLLDDFPQYSSLFVVAPEANGEVAFAVGHSPELPPAWLVELAQIETPQIGPVAELGGRRVQIASAPILNANGERLATLHATLRVSRLSRLLDAIGTSQFGSLSIVDDEGTILASSRAQGLGQLFEGPRLAGGANPERVIFRDYETEGGDARVGGLLPFPRFDWTIVYEEPYATAFEPIVAAISRVMIINLAIVLVMCIAAFRIAVSIVRPIEALSDAASRIADGEKGVEIPAQQGDDEVAVLSRVFRGMTTTLTSNAAELEQSHATIEETAERLRQKNEELQEMNEVLEQLSITDGLTKLHNHRYFQEALTSECKRADRTGEPLALILIDIDEFKKWNDRLGHAGGDEILRKMAGILNDGVRETDLLARYGGEEFALLAPDTHLLGAAKLGEKLRNDIASTSFFLEPPSERSRVTVSVGVAIYHGDRRQLFVEADQALYRAKDSGRDCVIIAEVDERAASDHEEDIEDA